MRSARTILVMCATGNQGRGVVRHCLQRGQRVCAFVRDPSSATAQSLEHLGAKLIPGNFDDIEALIKASQSVDAVFHLEAQTADFVGDLQRSRNVLAAARSSGRVSTVVVSTAVKTGQHESFPGWGPAHPMRAYWLNKHEIENMVREAGFPCWTIVRPGYLLQNFTAPVSDVYFPNAMEDATLRVAWKPRLKLPWLDAGDVGAVVADVVDRPEKFHGREIDLAVEALDIEEMAQKLTVAQGREFKVHYYSQEEEEEELAKRGPMIPAQRWANEVFGTSANKSVKGASEFPLTSVSRFFKRNRLF
ncbi:Nitrogen metabolite repression protein nmrA [Madurella mycetomatis]|uniref:Nitrogen metabolite repression protein nmrA n=1 Tax=Madurella mycetomatis TaxID=100816 RepID=A0A175VP12_9PEZI|nr:Nitrogen metabolite repression protein nmrA [Madurella mycetomatis]